MWEPKCGSLKSAGKRQENTIFLQRCFVNVAMRFVDRCSATRGDVCTAEKNVAVQLLQREGPKITAPLLFLFVACCRGGGGRLDLR